MEFKHSHTSNNNDGNVSLEIEGNLEGTISRREMNLSVDFEKNGACGHTDTTGGDNSNDHDITDSCSGSGSADDEDDEFDIGTMKECFSSLDLFQGSVEKQVDGTNEAEPSVSGGVNETTLAGLPPPSTFLHPAAAAGMHRVSSCYFSIASRTSEDDDEDHDGFGCYPWDGDIMDDDDVRMRECRESAVDLLQLFDQSQIATAVDRDMQPTEEKQTNVGNDVVKDDAENIKKIRKELSPDQLRSSRFVDEYQNGEQKEEEKIQEEENNHTNTSDSSLAAAKWNAVDVLYHDIMMHVLTFLPAKCLASFSETARRPNFECFYFLQLQLQRALLYLPPAPSSSDQVDTIDNAKRQPEMALSSSSEAMPYSDAISPIGGSGSISRLAATDPAMAQSIVQEYLDSNTTLQVMPLSHSLAYLRHALMRHGLHFPQNSHGPGENAARTAAVFITLVGAASMMSGAADNVMGSLPSVDPTTLRDALLGAGLAGSIMKAVGGAGGDERKEDEGSEGGRTAKMRQLVENMSRILHGRSHHYHEAHREEETSSTPTLSRFPSALSSMLHGAFSSTQTNADGENEAETAEVDPRTDSSSEPTASSTQNMRRRHRSQRSRAHQDIDKSNNNLNMNDNLSLPTSAENGSPSNDLVENTQSSDDDRKENTHYDHMVYAMEHPVTPNPYEHLTAFDVTAHEESKGNYGDIQDCDSSFISKRRPLHMGNERLPSGCVGAYTRAVHRATSELTRIIKQRQKEKFFQLPKEDQEALSAVFLDACTADDNVEIVKDLVQKRGTIDVDGYYVGDDGTESCALHSAAFNGSNRVLEFLCRGLDEHDSKNDGGLCDVNQVDDNGWTALHFAAGSNNVEAVRILASNGAKLTIEAFNGYTPYHWAERLSNKEVAAELKKLGADERFLEARWVTRKPFASFFSNRFFSLVPAA